MNVPLRFRTRVLLVGALIALAACGGGAASSVSAPLRASAGGTTAAGTAAAPQPGSSGVDRSVSSLGLPPLSAAEGSRVQRMGRLVLEVASGRFDATLNEVIAVVDQAGGYVAGTQAEADNGQRMRSGQATFQVPADRFDDVLAEIRHQGTLQSLSITGNDVSQQYVDLQARLGNAEAQRNAMLALMQQARSVSDTIQIQTQLGQVTAQIEELKGQIDYLDHSTAYATLSVTIREEAAGGRTDEWGLQTAVSQALHNTAAMVSLLILWLGTLSPIVVIGLGLGLVGWRLRWRLPGRRSGSVGAPGQTARE